MEWKLKTWIFNYGFKISFWPDYSIVNTFYQETDMHGWTMHAASV